MTRYGPAVPAPAWTLLLIYGLILRADIIAIYESESGSNHGAADNAIDRWLKAGL